MSSQHKVENLIIIKRCKHCKKKVVDSLDCERCNSSFHPSCGHQAGVVNKSGKVYCCDPPEISEVRSRKPSNSQDLLENMDEKKLKTLIRDSFHQFLAPIEKKIDKKFEEFEKSVQYMSNSFDEQKKKFDDLMEEVKVLRRDNETLKNRLQLLEAKFDDMEVKERKNNILVVGVPKQDDPDTGKIISKIATAMQVSMAKNDIIDSFRVNNNDNGPIMVKLRNQNIKIDMMKKIKQLKGITVEKCQLQGTNQKIYLNEDLPVNKRMLLKKLKEIQRQNGFKAVFCRNGVIYLKRNEQDRPIKIRTESDMQALLI